MEEPHEMSDGDSTRLMKTIRLHFLGNIPAWAFAISFLPSTARPNLAFGTVCDGVNSS